MTLPPPSLPRILLVPTFRVIAVDRVCTCMSVRIHEVSFFPYEINPVMSGIWL